MKLFINCQNHLLSNIRIPFQVNQRNINILTVRYLISVVRNSIQRISEALSLRCQPVTANVIEFSYKSNDLCASWCQIAQVCSNKIYCRGVVCL